MFLKNPIDLIIPKNKTPTDIEIIDVQTPMVTEAPVMTRPETSSL